MYRTAFNPTDAPVVIDSEGRTIGGGEWGTVDTTASETAFAGANGTLHIFNTLDAGPGQAEGANEAVARTNEITAMAERLSGLEKDELAEMAGDAGVTGATDRPKAELVHELAHRLDSERFDATQKAKQEPEEGDPATPPQEPERPSRPSRSRKPAEDGS